MHPAAAPVRITTTTARGWTANLAEQQTPPGLDFPFTVSPLATQRTCVAGKA